MKSQKKIVFKVSEFPHLSETFIIAQVITAIKLGYSVQILIKKYIDDDRNSYSNLIRDYKLLDKIVIEDYKIPKTKLFRLIKWIYLLILNLSNIFYIFNYFNEQTKFSLTWLYQWVFYKKLNDVAIFHVQYGTNSKPLDLLKKTKYFKPAIVVTFHGHDAFFPINGIQKEGYYDALFEYSSLISVNTLYLAQQVLQLGCPKEKLKIIPVGVDTDFFYPKSDKKVFNETLKVLSVGRLVKIKGHCYGIEAISELIKKGLDISLTIIGEGPERNNLKKIILEHGLEKNVFLVGKKNHHDVREAMWQHDLYLLTAIALPNGRRETQGLATLEAQACGLPVLAFDSGGVKYTIEIERTGYLIEECNVEMLVQKFEYLFKNPKSRIEFGLNTKGFINENFSLNHINSLWEKEYRNIE